jgi:predicted nucleic acid-binding protein
MQFTVKEQRRENSMIFLDTDILIEIFDKGSAQEEEIRVLAEAVLCLSGSEL